MYEHSHNLLVIHLKGTQAELGREHGEITRTLGGYERTLNYYPTMPARLLVRGAPPGVGRRVIATAMRPFIEGALRELEKVRPPDYQDRGRQFLMALGRNPNESRYTSIMDVFQNIVGIAGHMGVVPRRAALAACSTAMVWGGDARDGHVLHARNFDFPGRGIWEAAPTVVFCTPDHGLRYGFISTRGAETPGITSFNEAGLTITVHTRFSTDVTFRGQGVVDLAHAISREASTLAEAVAVAARERIASTWGIAISSRDEEAAIVIETSAAGVRVVSPTEPGHLVCANRYHHPDMQTNELELSPLWAPHTEARERTLSEHIVAARDAARTTASGLARTLGSHIAPGSGGVPRGTGCLLASPISVQSVVFDRTAEELLISVGDAPTGWGPYVHVPLSWDAPVGVREVVTDDDTIVVPWRQPFEEPAQAEAFTAFLEAVDADPVTTRAEEERAMMLRAVAGSPADPSYRFLAAGLAMQCGDLRDARVQLDAAITFEERPFRLAQYHMWAARVAAASGDLRGSHAFGKACCGSVDAFTIPYRLQVEEDRDRRWTRRRLRHIHLNYEMGDLEL